MVSRTESRFCRLLFQTSWEMLSFLCQKNSGLATTSRRHLDLYQADEGTKSIKVKSKTLADIFSENKIEFCDFIKMDCEGAEYNIFYNVSSELFRKIGVMTIECHEDGSINELMKFIRKRGFDVKRPSMEFGEIFCVNLNLHRSVSN